MNISKIITLTLAITSLSLTNCVGISLFSDANTDKTTQNQPIPTRPTYRI